MEDLWGILLVVGPLALIGAMYYGWAKNRKMTPREEERSDAGVRALREEIENEPERPADL